jgi:type IX secretion system PorP/SprF family membrane protein
MFKKYSYMARFFLMLLLTTTTYRISAQQQIQFSQYVFNGLAVNPAYAGYRGDTYLSAIYRNQWVGFPGSPKTAGISIDGLFNGHNENMGWGFQMMSDKMGPTNTSSFYGNYAYRIQLDNADTKRLCIGIGFGASQYSIDGTALQYVDENDQTIPIVRLNRMVPDANFGIYYYTPKSYIGFSVMDLLNPKNVNNYGYQWNQYKFGSMKRSRHMYLTAGTLITLSENVKFRPSFLWKEDFKGPSNFDLNAFLLLQDKIWIGASYRTGVRIWNKQGLDKNLTNQDAFAGILELIANERIRIGYSYDIMLNGLNNYQRGSHELSIGLRFARKDNRIYSPRYF